MRPHGFSSGFCAILALACLVAVALVTWNGGGVAFPDEVARVLGAVVERANLGATVGAPSELGADAATEAALGAVLEELRSAAAGQGSTAAGLPCPGPVEPEPLPEERRSDLKAAIQKATKKFGYSKLSKTWKAFAGLQVIDIGMGQGPCGVVAVSAGVRHYTGLDPALCIDRPARTRYKTQGRTASEFACEGIGNSSSCLGLGKECRHYRDCVARAKTKYAMFPFTGLQMMQAFPDRLKLLPGTFETLQHTGLLRQGMFDAATLWCVTEHLPDNRLVIEGVFRWMSAGQILVINHHNYYGYDGHHGVPKLSSDFDATNPVHVGVANWRHVDEESWVYPFSDMNHVRLGDLSALVHVYFRCTWRTMNYRENFKALKAPLFAALQQRGFERAELLINHWHAACERRSKPLKASWLDSRVWHHPPTNGSYVARPLPMELAKLVAEKEKECAAFSPVGTEHLRKYLPQ